MVGRFGLVAGVNPSEGDLKKVTPFHQINVGEGNIFEPGPLIKYRHFFITP